MSEGTGKNLGALGNLVNQFSSAMDCFRELVQNSVDAGSSQVEISTEYRQAEEGSGGAILIRVQDWGEGMDREVIDRKFTRLFASTKRQDLTKIGKFGIGFVSVFALKPKAVIVHTGRDGNYWEVFFDEDRTFQITPLDHPLEGTQITLLLEGDIRRYEELVEEIRKTLRYWCCHSEAEVGFEDRTPLEGHAPRWEKINEAFLVSGRCALQEQRGSTQVSLAFAIDGEHQFFNRGLTLSRGIKATEALGAEYRERFSHISFKISSPHFGHTLTRETVVRDESFHEGMKLLDEILTSSLVPALADQLEELVQLPEWTVPEVNSYEEGLSFLAAEPLRSLENLRPRRILRTIDGRAVSLQELSDEYRKEQQVLMTQMPSELLDRLLQRGKTVFFGSSGALDQELGPVQLFLRRALMAQEASSLAGRFRFSDQKARWSQRRVCFSPEEVFLSAQIEEEPSEEIRAFLDRVEAFMRSLRSGYGSLKTCRLLSAEADVPLFLVTRDPSGKERELRRPGLTREPWKWTAAVNRHHPHFLRLYALFGHHPALAAAMLGRCLCNEALQDSGPESFIRPLQMAVVGGL